MGLDWEGLHRMRVGHGLERLVDNDDRRILAISLLACC